MPAREDFPKRDDANWMRHSLIWLNGAGDVHIRNRPVRLDTGNTRFDTVAPVERVY